MKTQAVVFEDVSQVALRTLDMLPPAPGEILIRTLYSTISGGTEGWALRNLFTWSATLYPCVPGYQRVGIVEALGEGVTGFAVGQRVVATVSRWENAVVRSQRGSHAGLSNSPVDEVYAVPDTVDSIDASATVVAQVGYNAANRVVMQPDDWIAVYGDGLIGQFAAQAAKVRGARVILVGHRAHRLVLAQRYSADFVVNSDQENVERAVNSITGGQHLTALLDSVQTEASQGEYLPLLPRGRSPQIVYCGFTPRATWADMAELQKREISAHFISGWNRPRMEAALALMASGALRLRPLVTHLVPYTQAPEMYRLNAGKTADLLGITLDWSGAVAG